ncbi:DUF2207 domain-containing protein [Nigerium massiliense]|uniref:DUF2207 domain-containing protein n=1 Tax=Nigerium massiliense TaxID=1522317 RepID=UPI00069504A9|nr:DUF2207 domain-containing protein [Nigerium massiliense]
MTSTDLGFLTIGVLALLLVIVARAVARQFHRDQIFADVPPGVIPADAEHARRERVRGGQEYDGEVAVAFAPPRGVRPALVGTVVDGIVESRDLTAMLVDLAVRGHLHITAVPADEKPNPALKKFARRPVEEQPKVDWRLELSSDVVYDELDAMESRLLNGLFPPGITEVRMTQLDYAALQALRETQVDLYREAVKRHWYRRHPQQKNAGPGCVFVGLGILFGVLCVVAHPAWSGVAAGVMVAAAGILLTRALRGRTARTAEGTAVRVQALGFKKYLATAESDQFKFEEAAGIFSRYLPYAMVFGVADHWAKTFGTLARRANDLPGQDVSFDLTWFDVAALQGLDFATDLLWLDALDGSFDLFDGEMFAAFGGDAVEGLSAFATSLGDFMGSLDFMDGLGDGCGDFDGCGDL